MKTISEIMPGVLQSLSPPSVVQPPSADSKTVWTKNLICRECNRVAEQACEKWQAGGNYSDECASCARKRRQLKFDGLCPELYRENDLSRLPQSQLKQAMQWRRGARGLILLGETGTGKTRVAWTLLRRLLVEDARESSFAWFDCIGFGHAIARHYREEDAEEWLDRMAAVDLLFFDDLGKLKLTERAEAELFGIIERRCARRLPIIATTNDTGDSLASRMTDNRGPAMIRRMREFCEPVQF